jgi:hypothetical protein
MRKYARKRRGGVGSRRTELFKESPPSVTLMMVGIAEMPKALRKALSGVFHLIKRREHQYNTESQGKKSSTNSCRLPTNTNVEFFSGTSFSTSSCTSAQSGHQGLPEFSSMEEKKTR